MSEFSSMDDNVYHSALNDYQSSLNSALESVAGANQSAQDKANKFNEILQASTGAVGAPLIAKGIGKTFGNVKSALKKQAGEKIEEMEKAAKQKAQDLIDSAKSKANDLVNRNPTQPDGDIPDPSPNPDIQETNLDDAIKQQENPPDPADEPQLEDTSSDAPTEDPFSTDAGENVPLDDLGDGADEAAQAAAKAAKAAKAARDLKDVDEGLDTGETITEGAAASEGFLNPILDLAPLALGLGLTLTGIFKKHHAATIPPPPAINPTFSFGQ